MIHRFSSADFTMICDKLAKKDKFLRGILREHGHPPMWSRPASFQSLVLTILEQQVSLASAYAAFKKLRQKIGYVTPAKILAMSDEEMRACYFSRQKIVYTRELARAILNKQINLRKLNNGTDEEIRATLKQIKGIGDWTVDVYLMHALQRCDLFPLGDIALVNSMKDTLQLDPGITKDEMLAIAESWRPYRTIAAMILWHRYIQRRGIKLGY